MVNLSISLKDQVGRLLSVAGSLSFYFKLIGNFESKVCLLVDSTLLDHVFLLIHSTNVFLMIGVFNLFAFNTVSNKVGFIASIFLFIFFLCCVLSVFFLH